jgi:hypothetical protein
VESEPAALYGGDTCAAVRPIVTIVIDTAGSLQA